MTGDFSKLSMSMRQALKLAGRLAGTIIICAAAGYLLLLLVFLIPTDKIDADTEASSPEFYREGTSPTVESVFGSHMLDNHTDALMVLSAGYPGDESLIDRATNVYHASMPGFNPAQVIVMQYSSDPVYYESYPRYWHGYLTFLKPLLYFMNYDGIRILNGILLIATAVILLFLLYKRKMALYIIPYLLVLSLLDPIAISYSLQYSSVYYIFSVSSIILLLKMDKWGNDIEKYAVLFTVTGCLTSYFDLLTYPLVTLGIPLTLYLCKSRDSLKDNLKSLLCLIISWGVGYSCMWALKWIIGGLLTSEDIIGDALSSAAFRVSDVNASGQAITFSEVFDRNFTQLGAVISVIALIYAAVMLVIIIVHLKQILDRKQTSCGMLFLFIAILPVIWYIVLSNHSYIHYFYTYRELTISVFALLCMLARYVSLYGHEKAEELKAREKDK